MASLSLSLSLCVCASLRTEKAPLSVPQFHSTSASRFSSSLPVPLPRQRRRRRRRRRRLLKPREAGAAAALESQFARAAHCSILARQGKRRGVRSAQARIRNRNRTRVWIWIWKRGEREGERESSAVWLPGQSERKKRHCQYVCLSVGRSVGRCCKANMQRLLCFAWLGFAGCANTLLLFSYFFEEEDKEDKARA